PVTGVASFVVTNDIDSNAVTNIVQAIGGQIFANSRSSTNPTTVTFLTIATNGGPGLLTGGFRAFMTNVDQKTKPAAASFQGILAVDSPGKALSTRVFQVIGQDAGNQNDAFFSGNNSFPIQFSYLDPTSVGVHTYYLALAQTVGSYQADNILLQAIELKR